MKRVLYMIRTSNGFSLIEFLIAITVLAILAGVVIAYTDPFTQMKKAQDARRKSDLAQIRAGLEQYYKDNGVYPVSTAGSAEKPYRITGFKVDHAIIDWGEEWQPYMQVLPKDSVGRNYVYYASSGRQAYWLYASLEREGLDIDSSILANGIDTIACGKVCNYSVSSPNVSP